MHKKFVTIQPQNPTKNFLKRILDPPKTKKKKYLKIEIYLLAYQPLFA